MTIEMVKEPGQGPFVWPAEPEDWRPWGREEFRKAEKDSEKQGRRYREPDMMWPDDMGTLREQAARLLREARGPRGGGGIGAVAASPSGASAG